eukprot:1160187-Pelagomonas_calceolata.AAC.6
MAGKLKLMIKCKIKKVFGKVVDGACSTPDPSLSSPADCQTAQSRAIPDTDLTFSYMQPVNVLSAFLSFMKTALTSNQSSFFSRWIAL